MDGSACDVENKVDTTEDAELGEADENDDEDYDYDLWHDFVGRDCEWDNKKDEDGGAGGGGRMNKTNGGVRGEVASKMPSGSANPSSTKGSGSAANKQRTAGKDYIVFCATPKSTSTFEDYIADGRDYSLVEECAGRY
ncbi:hypothetical protein Bca4012_020094 [Brassica carinata]|uniref:Uncharacterized protein n=1 Tax=Brassica carinata TaxID=52824 RepID=A0A8X7WJ66_BRACI|nr:hypothetical protein Bca52824_001482 [Brassica carinata]